MLVLGHVARNWWVLVLQGLLAVLFGILALAQPGITLEALVLLFAFWALINGVLALISSIGAAEKHETWWPFLLMGLLGIAAGLLTLRWPGITALTLLFVIAYWSIFTGILQIAAAVRLRHEVQGELWLILGGIASVVFGVLLVLFPGSGALAVVWLIGIYAIVFGVALVMVGFRLKGLAEHLPAPAPARR
jgi:uncharacterized membrane protein HdeD (DUF308 family)